MHKFLQLDKLVMLIQGVVLGTWMMHGAVQGQEYTRGTRVFVRLVDPFSGAVVTTIDGRINFDSDAPLSDNISQPITNGRVEATLVSGVSYRAAIDFKNTVGEALSDREGKDYLIENPVIRFTSPSKGPIVIDYMVRPARASLSVTVVSPTSGQQLTGFVSAVSGVARHRVEAPFSGSTPVKLPVIEDSAYIVRVLANGGSSFVAPPEERLIYFARSSFRFF